MTQPTAKQVKEYNRKVAALSARVLQGGDLDADSLARSYGLPLADVKRALSARRN